MQTLPFHKQNQKKDQDTRGFKCVKLIWCVKFQAALKWTRVEMSYVALEMKTKKILQNITVLLPL